MNWSDIASGVSKALTTLAPIVEAAYPAASPALSIAEKIAQGVIAGTPEAVALYEQVKNGTSLTQAQVAAFEASYEADYQQLKADLAADIASATT